MIISLLIGAALQAATLPEPLRPASEGKLQCYTPNVQKKTCASLASYRLSVDGGIDNSAQVGIPGAPFVMKSVTSVRMEDGKLCGSTSRKDIEDSTITRDDRPASPAEQAEFKAILIQATAPIHGRTICTLLKPDAGGFVAQAWVDGQRVEAWDQKMIWVSLEDGYEVAL